MLNVFNNIFLLFQWVTSAKLDLEKEVESLKAVLEMKNKELHTIRVQNLEMEKQV